MLKWVHLNLPVNDKALSIISTNIPSLPLDWICHCCTIWTDWYSEFPTHSCWMTPFWVYPRFRCCKYPVSLLFYSQPDGSGKVSGIIEQFPEIDRWIIVGHSLGGVWQQGILCAIQIISRDSCSGPLTLLRYPGKNSKKGSPRTIRRTLEGKKMIIIISKAVVTLRSRSSSWALILIAQLYPWSDWT